jgi:hypothetical protein
MKGAAVGRAIFPHSADDKRSGSRPKRTDRKRSVTASKPDSLAFLSNVRVARTLWGRLSKIATGTLRELTAKYRFSVAAGDLLLLAGRWYISHAGLLRLSLRKRCSGINATLLKDLSDPALGRWVFRATVYKSADSQGFVGYGDADPSNCSTLVHGAEMRVAETRAVNRALRKAYGIGLCSIEELGSLPSLPRPTPVTPWSNKPGVPNGSNSGQPRLRDQLCLLVRKHNLNPTLVKAYAADFCGTETLSGASRNLVESFISHLSATATENRDALVCKLNSYSAEEPQS